MEKEIIYNEIDIEDDDIKEYLEKEIMILLRTGEQYYGILRDIDDEEVILSRPNSIFSLGFRIAWITNIFVKEE